MSNKGDENEVKYKEVKWSTFEMINGRSDVWMHETKYCKCICSRWRKHPVLNLSGHK